MILRHLWAQKQLAFASGPLAPCSDQLPIALKRGLTLSQFRVKFPDFHELQVAIVIFPLKMIWAKFDVPCFAGPLP